VELPLVVKALLEPRAYPDKPPAVEFLQTHISYLFFTPRFVYKIKKPVNFGFLDFTTLRKRHYYCNREVELNRRLAGDVYRGVVAVKKGRGGIGIGGTGRTIEYAVKMKRLPREEMLNEMVVEGRITKEMVERIGAVIARFHCAVPRSRRVAQFGLPSVITKNTEENFSQTESFRGRTVSAGQLRRIADYTREMLKAEGPLFRERAEGGFIKELHGDIHSDHVSVTDGVRIFDCIEFNRRFRCSDVVSDMAFLAMDLDYLNRHDLSKAFGTAYFEVTRDGRGEQLLNFYKCYRAYVRGKVESFKLDEEEVGAEEKRSSRIRAMRYFHLADLYGAGGFRPTLIIVCGLTGTGKTTLASALAEQLGFERLSSDIVRKELAGVAPGERRFEPFGRGIYREDFTEKTYGELLGRGETLLKAGRSVILDATFSRAAHREQAIKAARKRGALFHIIVCEADEAVIRRRLAERSEGAPSDSDGRWEIYEQQRERYEAFLEQQPHMTVDTSQRPEKHIIPLLTTILG